MWVSLPLYCLSDPAPSKSAIISPVKAFPIFTSYPQVHLSPATMPALTRVSSHHAVTHGGDGEPHDVNRAAPGVHI